MSPSSQSTSRLDWQLAVAATAVLVAAVLAVVSLARDGISDSGSAPGVNTQEISALVPANALVFVHVSLDERRPVVGDLAAVAERFPSYVSTRDKLVDQLASPDCKRATDALAQADDAALALYESSEGSGLSLLLIDRPEGPAQTKPAKCGALLAADIGDYLPIGQTEAIADARRLAAGTGKSLASTETSSGQLARLPGDRVLDGWISVDGVRRLLAPRGGAYGLVGAAVDQPGLRGLAFSVSPSDSGADVALRSSVKRTASDAKVTEADADELLSGTSDDAIAAFVVPRLSGSLSRLGGASAAGVGLLSSLPKDVAALFDRPTAISLLDGQAVPVLVAVTTTEDEAKAKRALAAMPADLRKQLFSRVQDGKLVLATRKAAVSKVFAAQGSKLTSSEPWRKTIGRAEVADGGSLLFLNFTKLLALAERTGLGEDASYRAVRQDLARLQAAGARTSPGSNESSVDLSLLIP